MDYWMRKRGSFDSLRLCAQNKIDSSLPIARHANKYLSILFLKIARKDAKNFNVGFNWHCF
jgi:hypothetical protein